MLGFQTETVPPVIVCPAFAPKRLTVSRPSLSGKWRSSRTASIPPSETRFSPADKVPTLSSSMVPAPALPFASHRSSCTSRTSPALSSISNTLIGLSCTDTTPSMYDNTPIISICITHTKLVDFRGYIAHISNSDFKVTIVHILHQLVQNYYSPLADKPLSTFHS